MLSQNIMLDLETLSTTADGVIMSIGAVRFDLVNGTVDTANPFYSSISIDSNTQPGHRRRIEESTLNWWMRQGEVARRVFNEAKVPLQVALASLADWIGDDLNQLVWSCGADFDLAMLKHAYESHSMELPWHYQNARCHRTFKNLPGAPARRREPTHHALQDALDQAQHLIEIVQVLFPGVTRQPIQTPAAA